MSSFERGIEQAVAGLVREPAFAAFSGPEAGVLVWSLGADRILWASRAAMPLRRALAGETGLVAMPDLDSARLKALAAGAAPRQGMQLERLRLNPLRYAAPLTCVCRLLAIADHGDVLVTAIAGEVPLAPVNEDAQPQKPITFEAKPSDRVAWLRRKHSVRFVWQADAELRFTSVTPALAEAVGPEAAAIAGESFYQLLLGLSQERFGAIAGHLVKRETWSGEIVYWPIDGTDQKIAVELAGLPVFDDQRNFAGYRGFGLCRGDRIRDMSPQATVAEAAVETPPSEREEAPVTQLPKPETSLSEADKLSLREIARALGGPIGAARKEPLRKAAEQKPVTPLAKPEAPPTSAPQTPPPSPAAIREVVAAEADPARVEKLLDLMPTGVLVHRGEDVLFANRVLLHMVGYANADKLAALGVVGLFRDSPVLTNGGRTEHPFMLTNADGGKIAVEVRLSSIEWQGVPASLMLINQAAEAEVVDRLRRSERDTHERGERIRELESILATATDGIVTLDEAGRILSLNGSGEALFGYDEREVTGDAITVLLAPESHMVALDYLDSLRLSGVASLLEGGREVIGKVRQGGTIALFMTIGRISDGVNRKLCVVLRDITAFKKAESELLNAKRAAEQSSEQKSELLAKISHEIRTPLNAIIGFAELMLEERLGPIGNERYKSYLKDMHTSGSHVMSLVNDLLDLAKIEAGHMELSFTGVHLNELVSSCVGMMQQQAARDRIVMRTSFAHKLPSVVADERSVRQIVLNLVSNAIKFTDAGGQVIVSTAMADDGSVSIRVRDTGIGMNEDDIVAALEPFRQLATARQRGGTGLGLPLTKALIEANRGSFEISSARNEGTLVEVIFPPTRVLAE